MRPDCWHALVLFSNMTGHFVHSETGFVMSLDWVFFESMLKYKKLASPSPDDFDNLLILEAEAIKLVNKRLKRIMESQRK